MIERWNGIEIWINGRENIEKQYSEATRESASF